MLDKEIRKGIDNPDSVILSKDYMIEDNSESSGVLSNLVNINFIQPSSFHNQLSYDDHSDDNDNKSNHNIDKKETNKIFGRYPKSKR